MTLYTGAGLSVMSTEVLAELLGQSWTKMTDEYARGLINSEATMQASLYHHLRSMVEGLAIFLEPGLESEDWEDSGKTYKPDMVICQGQTVLAIVELKCSPEDAFASKNDIKKLCAYAKHWNNNKTGKTGQPLDLDPQVGKYKCAEGAANANFFTIDPTALLVFGLITRTPKLRKPAGEHFFFEACKERFNDAGDTWNRFLFLSANIADGADTTDWRSWTKILRGRSPRDNESSAN